MGTLIGARRGRLGLVLTARRPPHSTIAPTASTHRGRHSTRIDEDTVVPLRSFNDNRFIFEEVEGVADGLGPTFNAQACRECHQNIVTGGASQVAEHRTGRLELLQFVESVGGSLIQSRSTNPEIFERVPFEDSVSTLRISTNLLGAGFIEAIANSTLACHSRPATRIDTWHGAGSGGARGQQRAAHRALRLEEPAREHGVVRCGCLSERDGHHHAGPARRKHLAGPRSSGLVRPTIRCPIPKMTASMWWRSPTSCVPPRRHRAAPSMRRCARARRCSIPWVAAAAMSPIDSHGGAGHAHQRWGITGA